MCRQCEEQADIIWEQLTVGLSYLTPDQRRASPFQIIKVESDKICIAPQNICINKDAFKAALHYLLAHGHDQHSPCEIRSNNNWENAGPLCQESRSYNGGVRCINYILPILKFFGVVDINPQRPNKAWIMSNSMVLRTSSSAFVKTNVLKD
jgi:hypothetical protein